MRKKQAIRKLTKGVLDLPSLIARVRVAGPILACFLFCTAFLSTNAHPLPHDSALISDDPTGRALGSSMIWTDEPAANKNGSAVAFRRSFEVKQRPKLASLAIFADARYVLWVNGQYVDRGPSRFQPNGPQYDVLDLSERLRPGRNNIAVLVIGRLSGGKVMFHAPGWAAQLTVEGRPLLATDSKWRVCPETRRRSMTATWADLNDSLVDARVEDGDWTAPSTTTPTGEPRSPLAAPTGGLLPVRSLQRCANYRCSSLCRRQRRFRSR